MIFKLVELSGATGQVQPALAYDMTRTHAVYLPMTDALRQLFCGRRRVFVEAEIEGGTLNIGRVVHDRGW